MGSKAAADQALDGWAASHSSFPEARAQRMQGSVSKTSASAHRKYVARLRELRAAQACDVLAMGARQGFLMQVGYDLGLIGAVLRQLAAGADATARVHVDPPEGERVARRLGTIERRAVIERHHGAAPGFAC